MFLPHMRHNEMYHTARLQHSLELLYHASRLRCMLQDNNRNNIVERGIGKRQFLEPAHDVEVRVVPGPLALRKINPDILRMSKQIFEPALARPRIEDPFPGLDFRSDAANERVDRRLERIQLV